MAEPISAFRIKHDRNSGRAKSNLTYEEQEAINEHKSLMANYSRIRSGSQFFRIRKAELVDIVRSVRTVYL